MGRLLPNASCIEPGRQQSHPVIHIDLPETAAVKKNVELRVEAPLKKAAKGWPHPLTLFTRTFVSGYR